jgi:hypothetical protein
MANVSKCCGAPVNVGGERTTHYYVCSRCHQPCEAIQTDVPIIRMLALALNHAEFVALTKERWTSRWRK